MAVMPVIYGPSKHGVLDVRGINEAYLPCACWGTKNTPHNTSHTNRHDRTWIYPRTLALSGSFLDSQSWLYP